MFGPSLSLGIFAGIPVRIHWSFGLLVLWMAISGLGYGGGLATAFLSVIFMLAVFVCVVLHEFGHSLTARHYGIETRSITLSPLGGIAALERSPTNWRQELWITLAGPAVNVVIALFLIPVVILVSAVSPVLVEPFSTPGNFLLMLLIANLMLAFFNMIPAFPMDGGRILRAVLASGGDRVKATETASAIGKVCAVLMGIAGLFFSPVLVLVAIFVFFAGEAERRMVQREAYARMRAAYGDWEFPCSRVRVIPVPPPLPRE